jgi:hypothetical protein
MPKPKKRPVVEFYHCNMCHKDLTGAEFDKQSAGYEMDTNGVLMKDEKGKVIPHKTRFSVFCNFCRSYLGFLDTATNAGINKPIN